MNLVSRIMSCTDPESEGQSDHSFLWGKKKKRRGVGGEIEVYFKLFYMNQINLEFLGLRPLDPHL